MWRDLFTTRGPRGAGPRPQHVSFSLLLVVSAVLLASAETPSPAPHIASLFKTVSGNTTSRQTAVTGDLPAWLCVSKYNNGFGQYEIGTGDTFTYLFDVLSHLTKWRICNGTVTFSNKLIESKYLKQSTKSIPLFRTFGGFEPGMNPVQKLETLVSGTSDNFNVNIQKMGQHLLAISDMAGELDIDPHTLDNKGLYKFDDRLSKAMSMITCAHPTQLFGDKYVYNYLVQVAGNMPHIRAMDKYQVFRMDTTAEPLRREVMIELPIENGMTPYMHQFGNTPRYLVFMQFPLHWDIMGISRSDTILPNMHWDSSNGTKVIVIEKSSWTVKKELWYPKAVFAYHYVNAFEDSNGDVQLDITLVPCEGSEGLPAQCRHMNSFRLESLRANSFDIPKNEIWRFTVPLSTQSTTVTASLLTNDGFDLIAINPQKAGRPYRFAYGTGMHGHGDWYNNLKKLDLSTGEMIEWHKSGHYPSEPHFIPSPSAVDEDDGVLLSTVLGGDRGTSYLLVLDARTMKPIAEANAPYFLPYSSHGTWVAE